MAEDSRHGTQYTSNQKYETGNKLMWKNRPAYLQHSLHSWCDGSWQAVALQRGASALWQPPHHLTVTIQPIRS